MKNLKKLSVVLFATLLSFNFTSCIDDEVSDAVDQVYLAQAEFLQAQAALKTAEAQFQMAKAEHEQAEAALTLAEAEAELAYARETDAYALQVEANTETITIANLFAASSNALALDALEATTAKAVADAQNALEAAMATHEAAMVALNEAVNAAADVVVSSLYTKYETAIDDVNGLQDDKLELMNDLAKKQLLMYSPDHRMTWAYAYSLLEEDLAYWIGEKAALEVNLAATQAMTATPEQQQVTDLEAQIAVIQDSIELKNVEKEEADVVADNLRAEWDAAADQYSELMDKMDEVATIKQAIKDHEADMKQDTMDIAEYQDIIDVQIPAAEDAVDDAVADYGDAIDDLEAAQDALGEETTPAPVAGDDALTGTTLYDILWNTQLAKADADYAESQANYYYSPVYPGLPHIVTLEMDYTSKEAILAGYVPGTPIADLEADLTAALAAEVDAQAAWTADPDGLTIDAGADGVEGEHTPMGTGETWAQITAYGLSGATFGTTYYDSFASVLIADGAAVAVDNNEDGDGGDTAPFGAPGTEWEVAADIDGTMVGEWFNVEADDTDTPNMTMLINARIAAYDAQNALDIEVDGVASVTEDRDDALAEVIKGYAALGYDWPTDGSIDASDILAVEDYIQTLADAASDAQDDVDDAQDDVNDAIAAIGSTFAEFDSPEDWIDLGSNDSAVEGDLNTGSNLTYFELVENALINWSIALQELDALGTVEENEDLIADEWKDIADIADLIPSHEYALAYLETELAELAAEFDLDPLLFDPEDGDDLVLREYLPAWAAYLDAKKLKNIVDDELDQLRDLKWDLEQIRDAVKDHLSDGWNVADFENWKAGQIANIMDDIDNAEWEIEKYTLKLEKEQVDKADMEAEILDCQRLITQLDEEIAIAEQIAADFYARLLAAMN